MDRFTISLDEELAAAFDELIKQRGYTTRSEAVRDILRDLLQRRDQASLDDHVRSDVNTTRALSRKNRQIPCV